MSTYILMKILESSPQRYDYGIRLLMGRKLNKAYEQLTSHIKKGENILDIGCGTGALSLLAARRGARVKGIDINPHMLEIANRKVQEEGLSSLVELEEKGIAELGEEKSEIFDTVMSGLCFSELNENEMGYGLKEIRRILKKNGLLLVADEVRPKTLFKKIFNWLLKFPLVIITFLLAQTTTHPVEDLPGKIREAGFSILSCQVNKNGNFMQIIARKA